MKKIWRELSRAFQQEASNSSDDDVAHFAAAALMIEMCEADFATESSELEAVANALRQVFSLDPAVIDKLIEDSRRNNTSEISYHPHVETINRLCGQREKASIVRSLWRVAAADGHIDKYEEHYLRRLCELIHVPHKVFVQTRNEVLEL
ncbi:MAG: TerB family tellurite resistance protein [Lysobacterales bacterium]